MLGAATKAQELTLQYALDRKQFGKPLAQFQVIQSYLAQMAGELSAARAMFATALRAAHEGAGASRAEAAAAKVRIGQAAQVITGLAHQVHGAIGFTEEYALQLWTRRLWAWREEFGNETEWARELGAAVIALGPEAYWERITQ
jgi:alkylation response protein AidB-like acyl-CoA dehydrogenase